MKLLPQLKKQQFYYGYIENGISAIKSKVNYVATNSNHDILLKSEKIKKYSLSVGIGCIYKEKLIYELSFSRNAFGIYHEIDGIYKDTITNRVPIFVSHYYNIWNAKFSIGYRFNYKRFEFLPLLGIAKPLFENTKTTTEYVIEESSGRWRIDIVGVNKFVNNSANVFTQLKLPLKINFRIKKKYLLGLGYSFVYSFSKRNFLFSEYSFSSGSTNYSIHSTNNGNFISHAFSITIQQPYYNNMNIKK